MPAIGMRTSSSPISVSNSSPRLAAALVALAVAGAARRAVVVRVGGLLAPGAAGWPFCAFWLFWPVCAPWAF